MDPMKKWDASVRQAKKVTSKKVGRFQVLKGSLLSKTQKIYCASTNFFSQ